MPLELEPGETVIFPAPYVATEQHPLLVTTKRVVQYAGKGAFPVAQIVLKDIGFIGRMSDKPYLVPAIAVALLGLILVIVGMVKVLPPVFHAGGTGAVEKAPEAVEGRDKDDDYPFEDGTPRKKSLKEQALKVQQLRTLSPGIPPITADLVVGLLLAVLGVGLGYGAYRASKKERYAIFLRSGDNVHRLEVADKTQQDTLLLVLQSVHRPK